MFTKDVEKDRGVDHLPFPTQACGTQPCGTQSCGEREVGRIEGDSGDSGGRGEREK